MSLSATLHVLGHTPKHTVEVLTFGDRDDPWVDLSVKSPGRSEFSILTDRPELLEEIAIEASKAAAWLRNERQAVAVADALADKESAIPF